MNANFGIIVLKADREKYFLPLKKETRSWGDEVVDVGEQKYSCPLLEGVDVQLYPITPFIRKKLQPELASNDIEYVFMQGAAIDSYAAWLSEQDEYSDESESHPFERGLLELLKSVNAWAVMFAPSGDRLENYLSIGPDELVSVLRPNVKSIGSSKGFLATNKT